MSGQSDTGQPWPVGGVSVFEKYDNVVACIGNHEPVRQMQGTVEDTKSLSELRSLVQASWCNDIQYASYIVKNKVMAILLDNSDGLFHQEQYSRLKADFQNQSYFL